MALFSLVLNESLGLGSYPLLPEHWMLQTLLVSVLQHSLTAASQVSCLSPGVPGTPIPLGMGSSGVLCGLHVLAGVPRVGQAGPQAMLWVVVWGLV